MRALLASYEKNDDLLRLARLLKDHGWVLLGSAGTAKFLTENGVICSDIADMCGKPILGHRVVTLAREIHAALLSRSSDAPEMAALGVEPIDLVYVTLYPLEKTIASPNATQDDVIEKTDIGGPTLLRAAAKGRRLALSDPSEIELLENWLSRGMPEAERADIVIRLAASAERRVANYVDASASYWEKVARGILIH